MAALFPGLCSRSNSEVYHTESFLLSCPDLSIYESNRAILLIYTSMIPFNRKTVWLPRRLVVIGLKACCYIFFSFLPVKITNGAEASSTFKIWVQIFLKHNLRAIGICPFISYGFLRSKWIKLPMACRLLEMSNSCSIPRIRLFPVGFYFRFAKSLITKSPCWGWAKFPKTAASFSLLPAFLEY